METGKSQNVRQQKQFESINTEENDNIDPIKSIPVPYQPKPQPNYQPKPQPNHQPQPNMLRNDLKQQNYIRQQQPIRRTQINLAERKRVIPEYEHVTTTFLTEKSKEFGDIGERRDLTPTQKLLLMDKNRKQREEFVKSEKIRFQRECRQRGVKLKWDDILEPEFNFKWLDFYITHCMDPL